MSSGIYFVGNYNLSLDDFSKFIEPLLIKKGYRVTDRAQFNQESDKGELVLIALSGEEDTETGLKQVLEEAGAKGDEHNLRKEEYEEGIPGSHTINSYTPIAVYSETSAASHSFAEVYRDYLSRRTLRDSQRSIDNLTEYEARVQVLQKKLKKLATTSLSEMG